MKTNRKYFLLSLITALAVTGMSLGTLGFAQTVTPVACSVNQSSVGANQAATFTATGGNGTYTWSGPSLSITNASGSQFAVSYPNAGVYTITVASAGQTASCNMTVTGTATSGSLMCSPATQSVTLGQTASVSATGGSGAYVWTSPDVTISNANGSGFSVNYASTGLKTLTVTSAGVAATCEINVLAGAVTPVTTPGLPNTGGGYGQQ
ncbi:MAG TPA: hypothetical protein VIJ88_00100 [Candidatus Paceibacterota bacterium]